MNGLGGTTAGFGVTVFAGVATGAGTVDACAVTAGITVVEVATGAAVITGAGAVAGTGIAAGATGVCGVIGEAGVVERTSGPAVFFLGIWIPVKILETSFCNPSLLLAIVQLPCGHSAFGTAYNNSRLINHVGLFFIIRCLPGISCQYIRLLSRYIV